MVIEEIVGVRETIRPEVSADGSEVYINKTIRRPPADAAIPPGQSLELSFFSVGEGFDVIVTPVQPYIATDERPTGTYSLPFTTARTSTTHGPIGSSIDGWTTQGNLPKAVFRARLEGPLGGPGSGWELAPPGEVTPPPQPEDRVVPFDITVTSPAGHRLHFVRPRASELKDLPWRGGFHSGAAEEASHGLWKVTVLNNNETAMRIDMTVIARHSVVDHLVADIPLSLINTLGATILKKTMVTVAYHGGNLVVETPTHFLALYGVDTEIALPALVAKLVDAVPTFSPVAARIESRTSLRHGLVHRKRDLYEALAPDPWADERTRDAQERRRQRVIDDMQREVDRLDALRPWQAVFCITIEGMFSDASVDLAFIGRIAELDNKLPQVAFVFDGQFQMTEVVSTMSIDMSPLLAKEAAAVGALGLIAAAAAALIFGPEVGLALGGLVILGGFALFNSINPDMEAELRDALLGMDVTVSHYVRLFVERLSGFGAVALGCELLEAAAADGSDVLRVSYCDPTATRPPRPLPLPEVDAAADPAFIGIMRGRASTAMTLRAPGGLVAPTPTQAVTFRSDSGGAHEVRHTLAREPAGPIPPEFVVDEQQTLATLDRHDCIVLVMMENRSFDHFFFKLAEALPGRGYEAAPDHFTNPPPAGWGEPFRPTKNQDVGLGHSLIFPRPFHALDPSHSLDHTMSQIGGGTDETVGTGQMQGFARDFALESDSPQVVMSYFSLDDLPTYRTLADNYAVCNRWFASLPLGTQPNRMSAFQGNVPFLYNLHQDDPSLGFLEDYSIFDLMDSQGITWQFFEGDIGTIRLYDRYRLNVSNVQPLSELRDTLLEARNTSRLPRVIVIEPEFLFGYDDHPPMDVRDGQSFVRDVVGQFAETGMLDRVLFVLTYDEHGGFFDHVPPPGTTAGPPEWLGNVADMFPEDPGAAPDSMGVRVPSIVMSKFISPDAKNLVLDHTSILKTILLHNRHRVSTDQFTRFGERAMRGAHLGQLMDLNVQRDIDYGELLAALGYEATDSWFTNRTSRLLDIRSTNPDPTHAGVVLHNIAAPRARRFVSGVGARS